MAAQAPRDDAGIAKMLIGHWMRNPYECLDDLIWTAWLDSNEAYQRVKEIAAKKPDPETNLLCLIVSLAASGKCTRQPESFYLSKDISPASKLSLMTYVVEVRAEMMKLGFYFPDPEETSFETMLCKQLIEKIISESNTAGSKVSIIALAAPERTLVAAIVEMQMLDSKGLADEFASCASKPGIDLPFMKWLASICKFTPESPPVVGEECHAFANACLKGKYDLAKWMFTEFKLGNACSHTFMRGVVEQLEKRNSIMADWIVEHCVRD